MAEHPITPPPELRRLWAQQAQRMYPRDSIAWQEHIANQAARWHADPDLWAYVKWIEDCGHHPSIPVEFRAARRPNPPSLKEQALAKLEAMERLWEASGNTPCDLPRRALEALPND